MQKTLSLKNLWMVAYGKETETVLPIPFMYQSTMESATQSLGVFVDVLARRSDCPTDENPVNWPNAWRAFPHTTPFQLRFDDDQSMVVSVLDGEHPFPVADQPVFEVVQREKKQFIAAVIPSTSDLRINGAAAPPAAILQVRDRIVLDGDNVLHVSQFIQPFRGVVPADQVGKECPLCLSPIVEQTICYICPYCGVVLHAQGEETAQENRLECHQMGSACACCENPIVHSERFEHVPED